MLRRPPTVLTLTSEDVKAYEDHREAEAFQHATAAAHLRRQQQLSRNMSGMDITGITTSSDDEDYSEQEASYYPNRTNSQNPRISREENIEGPLDEGIYRNEEDPDDYEDASDGGLAREEAFTEDQYMAEAEQMDLDAEHTDDDDDDDNGIPGAAIPNPHHTRRQQQHQQQQQQQEPTFPSPPPAPSRLTRSTRSASTEPSSSQAQHEQQQQQQAPAARLPRGAGAAQTHRRAPSGRAAAATTAADATTPTPAAQAQRDAAERIHSRTTRSRDERIGVARGGRR